jgi:hypothetical protein
VGLEQHMVVLEIPGRPFAWQLSSNLTCISYLYFHFNDQQKQEVNGCHMKDKGFVYRQALPGTQPGT